MDGLFITGTGTEIGKTIVTALLALGLRKQGVNACPVKPVASGGVIIQGEYVSSDAQVYRRLSGVYESASRLNPLCFKDPVSPHLAAQMTRQSIEPEVLRNSLNRLAKKYDVLLVEGVGGWLVPLTYYYKVADFARDLHLPVLLVSANRLGAINHTLLTLESIRFRGIKPAGVIFTHPEPVSDAAVAENNIETIERVGQVDILGNIPYLGEDIEHNETSESLWPQVEDDIQWKKIYQILHIQ